MQVHDALTLVVPSFNDDESTRWALPVVWTPEGEYSSPFLEATVVFVLNEAILNNSLTFSVLDSNNVRVTPRSSQDLTLRDDIVIVPPPLLAEHKGAPYFLPK